MTCHNCGGPIQYPKLYRGRRYCSLQCTEYAQKREQERERKQREQLVSDECRCTRCRDLDRAPAIVGHPGKRA